MLLIEQKPEPVISIITREEWGALPPKKEEEIDLPAKFITFSSTRTDACYTREDCIKIVREIQEEQLKKGLPDILPK